MRVAREEIVRLHQGDIGAGAGAAGELSPDGAYAALTIPRGGAGREALVVLNLTTGRSHLLPGTLTDLNGNARIAWTPNSRWLLAITDHQMRAYDTVPTRPAWSPSPTSSCGTSRCPERQAPEPAGLASPLEISLQTAVLGNLGACGYVWGEISGEPTAGDRCGA